MTRWHALVGVSLALLLSAGTTTAQEPTITIKGLLLGDVIQVGEDRGYVLGARAAQEARGSTGQWVLATGTTLPGERRIEGRLLVRFEPVRIVEAWVDALEPFAGPAREIHEITASDAPAQWSIRDEVSGALHGASGQPPSLQAPLAGRRACFEGLEAERWLFGDASSARAYALHGVRVRSDPILGAPPLLVAVRNTTVVVLRGPAAIEHAAALAEWTGKRTAQSLLVVLSGRSGVVVDASQDASGLRPTLAGAYDEAAASGARRLDPTTLRVELPTTEARLRLEPARAAAWWTGKGAPVELELFAWWVDTRPLEAEGLARALGLRVDNATPGLAGRVGGSK